MTWDRVEGVIGAENLKLLAQKRVGIIGLGSGGGFVAQSLAMSGIGKFVLVDAEELEKVNVVRHVADSRYISQPKAEVMAELIRNRNADAEIDVRIGKIEQNLDILDNLDLLVVGVDGEQAKYIINEACLQRGLTAIYAGVYERGEGGDVVVIRPHAGPCYACWASQLREGVQLTRDENQELDYGMIGPEGTLEAEPGLWLHVVRVAATQADFTLKELLRDTSMYQPYPGNTVILANNAIEILEGEITPPHSAVWVDVQRDPHCLVCGDSTSARITQEISLDDFMNDAGIEFEEENQKKSHKSE